MTTHDSSASAAPRGALSVARVPLLERPVVRTLTDLLHFSGVGFARGEVRAFRKANRAMAAFDRSVEDQQSHLAGSLPYIGHLWLAKVRRDGSVLDFGLVGARVVTNSGVNFLTDAMQGLVEPEALRFHGVGTSSTAESVTQTGLLSELTTQYSQSNTRPQGTLGEKSGSANVFETVATVTVSASVALQEHGVFSQAAVGGGVLLDRSTFAVVNLGAGESLQATYQLTFPSGG